MWAGTVGEEDLKRESQSVGLAQEPVGNQHLAAAAAGRIATVRAEIEAGSQWVEAAWQEIVGAFVASEWLVNLSEEQQRQRKLGNKQCKLSTLFRGSAMISRASINQVSGPVGFEVTWYTSPANTPVSHLVRGDDTGKI